MKTIHDGRYLNLLDSCFKGIKSNLLRCEELGFEWKSKPFIKEVNGDIASHVGLLDYPMVIDGRDVNAAALHAICTSERHRGQGLSSELIQEAIAWAKERYELVVLFTKIPEFYERFAFRTVAEQQFHLPYHHEKGLKPLAQVTAPRDLELFRRCYEKRVPLSKRFWVEDRGDVTRFNSLFATYPEFWSLHYSPSLNAILSFSIEDKTLHLFDVVASRIPSLHEVLEHLPSAIKEIYFYFSLDLFTDAAKPEPQRYDDGIFMVRGPWTHTEPFMVPLLSRC